MTTTRSGPGTVAVAVAVVVRDGAPVRFPRVQAVALDVDHAGGPDGPVQPSDPLEPAEPLELRGDADGLVRLAALAPGRWSLLARDARRTTCSAATVCHVGATGRADLTVLALEHATTGALAVDVVRGDRRRPRAAQVTVVDLDGHRVTATARDGLAHVRGLRPGRHTAVVAPGLGHLGTAVDVDVEADGLLACVADVPAGGVVSGRVLQGGALQYAAVVRLLGGDGVELERTRTDADGRFVLGHGLPSSRDLTVEATSGPQTLHVTGAAVADVVVLSGTHRDLGDLLLPVAGSAAVWATRTRAVAAMKLPSTRA